MLKFYCKYQDLVDDIRMLAPQHEDIVLALLLSNQIYDAASLYSALKVCLILLLSYTIMCARKVKIFSVLIVMLKTFLGGENQESVPGYGPDFVVEWCCFSICIIIKYLYCNY